MLRPTSVGRTEVRDRRGGLTQAQHCPPDSYDAVTLHARLVINAKGAVTRVDFDNQSSRTRSFERAARKALLQWRFHEGSGERWFRAEVSFRPE